VRSLICIEGKAGMRIECCYCGVRGSEEFQYLGDATVQRPDADPIAPLDQAAREQWMDYVYWRDNPAGPHRELWQHVSGCRAWLVVTRDTRTHEVLGIEAARDVALARQRSVTP
jgi:methylglutamate dehydrogenase subunit B